MEGATTQNVVILRSLARYFGCESLMKSANKFIQTDLSECTALEYLLKSSNCNDNRLEEAARNLIVDKYDSTHIEQDQLLALPVELFRSVICSPNLKECHSKMASLDVMHYFEKNPEVLCACLLHELTSNLTEINSTAAAGGLMEMIKKLDPKDEANAESHLALDRLCELCAKKFSHEWRSIDTSACMSDSTNFRFEGDYRGSGRLLVLRSASALNQAKDDYKTLSDAKKEEIDMKSKDVELLRKQNAELTGANALLKARNTELEQMLPQAGSSRKRSRKMLSRSRLEAT